MRYVVAKSPIYRTKPLSVTEAFTEMPPETLKSDGVRNREFSGTGLLNPLVGDTCTVRCTQHRPE